jgi:Domain of unknown function (DUF4136)
MRSLRAINAKTVVLAAGLFAGGLFLAGCDEYVRITRDPDLRIPKHATWAWRTSPDGAEARDSRDRRVISRDLIGRGEREPVVRDASADTEALREKVKLGIEQTLMQKGFKQETDPEDADFVVDFHLAVRRRNVTRQRVYPGAYPGLVCGPFGCWESLGWGPAAVGYEHIRFREGTIVLDITQNPSNHLAYRAVGQKPLRHDRLSFSQDEVNSMARAMLKDLKPH